MTFSTPLFFVNGTLDMAKIQHKENLSIEENLIL
jgi:hypothetical protein